MSQNHQRQIDFLTCVMFDISSNREEPAASINKTLCILYLASVQDDLLFPRVSFSLDFYGRCGLEPKKRDFEKCNECFFLYQPRFGIPGFNLETFSVIHRGLRKEGAKSFMVPTKQKKVVEK